MVKLERMTLRRRRSAEQQKRKTQRRKDSGHECRAHLQWVRGFPCLVEGVNGHVCEMPIVAHHIRVGTGGGTGLRPADANAVPLCDGAHRELHQHGERSFSVKYRVDLGPAAEHLWSLSPHGQRWRFQHSEGDEG